MDINFLLGRTFTEELEIAFENPIPINIRSRARPKADGYSIPNGVTSSLLQDLEALYGRIKYISLVWDISDSLQTSIITGTTWFLSILSHPSISNSYRAEVLGGNLQIVSAVEMFQDKKYLAYLNTPTTQYLPLDRHWSLTACLKRENGRIENNVYLFNAEDPDKVHDMGVGVLKYLELAYHAKAMYHWQYAYLFRDSIHNEKLRMMLPIIFPHVQLDLSAFGILL